MLYILTYNLRNFEHDYADLYSAIKNNCDEYHHFMESSWFIKTDMSAKEFEKKISPYFLTNHGHCDTWFIAELPDNENREGMMGTSAWKFLKEKKTNEEG